MTCTGCGETKPVEDFYIRDRRTNQRRRTCKVCDRQRYNRYAAKPESFLARREAAFRRKYGITQMDFEELRERQGGCCALCKLPPSGGRQRANGLAWHGLVVDHNHNTGRVRGLLCHPCNTWLGRLEDRLGSDLELISSYLARGK